MATYLGKVEIEQGCHCRGPQCFTASHLFFHVCKRPQRHLYWLITAKDPSVSKLFWVAVWRFGPCLVLSLCVGHQQPQGQQQFFPKDRVNSGFPRLLGSTGGPSGGNLSQSTCPIGLPVQSPGGSCEGAQTWDRRAALISTWRQDLGLDLLWVRPELYTCSTASVYRCPIWELRVSL